MMGSDFLAELHAQHQTPRPVVLDLVGRATGAGVDELTRLIAGDENEVYRARLGHGPTVYARIGWPAKVSFEPEAWAMGQARSAGVPAPEVLAVEVLDLEGGRPAMVLAESPGRPLIRK